MNFFWVFSIVSYLNTAIFKKAAAFEDITNMDILIIKLGAMGDVVRTTSLLPGLFKKYPGARIFWVTKRESLPLLEHNPFLQQSTAIEEREQIKELGKKNFALAINLDDEIESCTLASSVRASERIGGILQDGKPSYTKGSSPWFDLGLISRFGKEKADELKKKNTRTYQDIISGIVGVERGKPVLELTEEEAGFGEEFTKRHSISKSNLVIGLNTAAGSRWKGKILSVEKTIGLAKELSKNFSCTLLLFGGPQERGRNGTIARELGNLIVDAGTDHPLREFAALVNLCDILITSDSLALHLGVALGKNVIVFFGPTSAAEIDLYGRGIKLKSKKHCGCFYNDNCTVKPWCTETIPLENFVNGVKELRHHG